MKSYAKKIFAILLTLPMLFLSSCGIFNVENHGLENFSVNDESGSLCSYIIPEGFIDMFPYESGDYHYSSECVTLGIAVCDRAILYFNYDDETYLQAKEYAMEHLDLSSETVASYNNYSFYNNDTPANNGVSHLSSEEYPYDFVRFAYNDEKKCLIFLGFSVSMELYDEVDGVSSDWGVFLDKYFSEYYDFS